MNDEKRRELCAEPVFIGPRLISFPRIAPRFGRCSLNMMKKEWIRDGVDDILGPILRGYVSLTQEIPTHADHRHFRSSSNTILMLVEN